MGKFLYILQSEKTGRYYVGSTDNPKRRLIEHNSGQTKSTRSGKPWKKVYSHEFATSQLGIKVERKIKSLKSRRVIGEIISGKIDLEALLW